MPAEAAAFYPKSSKRSGSPAGATALHRAKRGNQAFRQSGAPYG
jgi:hypothetical protein